MTPEEKIACVRAGLKREPTEQEIKYWLYGEAGRPMSEEEQIKFLEKRLAGSPNEWQVKTLGLIRQIPRGCLITYGELARWTNKEHGLNIIPRNTARLRESIYHLIMHDTDIPIHRIAKQDDIHSHFDLPVTQEFNHKKRSAEGTLILPIWFRPR